MRADDVELRPIRTHRRVFVSNFSAESVDNLLRNFSTRVFQKITQQAHSENNRGDRPAQL